MSWLNQRSLEQPRRANAAASRRPAPPAPQAAAPAPARHAGCRAGPVVLTATAPVWLQVTREGRRDPVLGHAPAGPDLLRSRRPRRRRCSRPASPKRCGSPSATRSRRRSARRRQPCRTSACFRPTCSRRPRRSAAARAATGAGAAPAHRGRVRASAPAARAAAGAAQRQPADQQRPIGFIAAQAARRT